MCEAFKTSGRFWIALSPVFKRRPFVPSPPSRESQVKGDLCKGRAFLKVFLKQMDQTQPAPFPSPALCPAAGTTCKTLPVFIARLPFDISPVS